MVRLSYQHRAFYCYVILSVWIFLLVAGKEKRKKKKKREKKRKSKKEKKKCNPRAPLRDTALVFSGCRFSGIAGAEI